MQARIDLENRATEKQREKKRAVFLVDLFLSTATHEPEIVRASTRFNR